MSEALSIAVVPLAGGGRIGICRMPGLLGALGADIETIVGWKLALVVSMVEQPELDQCGSRALGDALAGVAIAWFHLPVRDYGGPEGRSRDAWPGLAWASEGLAKAGKRV